MQHLCPRCGYSVQEDEDGALIYCRHCGMPQVRLSEEFAERAAQERNAFTVSATGDATPVAPPAPPPPARPDPFRVDWRIGVQSAALAGGIAIVLTLLSAVVPPLGIIGLLWAVSAPIVVLGLYLARAPKTRLTVDFSSKLGALTGLFIMIGMSTVNTVQLLLQRYVQHNTARFDGQIDAIFAQAKAGMLQGAGADAAKIASFAATLDVPEFRTGFLLATLTIFTLMYLAFRALGGAFAGALRTRKP